MPTTEPYGTCSACHHRQNLNKHDRIVRHNHNGYTCVGSHKPPAPGSEQNMKPKVKKERGVCSECGCKHALTRQGMVSAHGSHNERCPGSGRRPMFGLTLQEKAAHMQAVIDYIELDDEARERALRTLESFRTGEPFRIERPVNAPL